MKLPAVPKQRPAWPKSLNGPGFTAPPRWSGWSAEVVDIRDGIYAQAWCPIRKGLTCYVTTNGEYLTVADGETPAEAYDQLQQSRKPIPISETDLADLEDNEVGQTHVTSYDYTQPGVYVTSENGTTTEPATALSEPDWDISAATASGEPDPYDISSFRIDPELLAVDKVRGRIPFRRPSSQQWFRVLDKPGFTADAFTFDHEEDGDKVTYLVHRNAHPFLNGKDRPCRLFVCVTRHGNLHLWPAKLPSGGQGQTWAESGLAAAEVGKRQWVMVEGNKRTGAYDWSTPRGDLGEPDWPDLTFRDIVEGATKGYYITSPDHPVIRELNGEL